MGSVKPDNPRYQQWLKNVGRKKKIESPEDLFRYFCDYEEKIDSAPHQREDFIRGGEMAGVKVKLKNMRPKTWAGFEVHLFREGILVRLDDYKANKDNRYAEFADVIHAINKIIFDHNFDGAAVNALKENLIARSLGLHDKTLLEITKEQPLFGEE